MIKLAEAEPKKERDSTIALINIVFLMLIFFLITGTIMPPIDNQIDPVSATTDQNSELDSLLSFRNDGTLYFRGEDTSVQSFALEFLQAVEDPTTPARLFVDENANAAKLVTTINELKSFGIQTIRIVTKRKT